MRDEINCNRRAKRPHGREKSVLDVLLAMHKTDPTLTRNQLAERVGCSPDYVRSVVSRHKLNVPRCRKSPIEAKAIREKLLTDARKHRDTEKKVAESTPATTAVLTMGRAIKAPSSQAKLQGRVRSDLPKEISHLRHNGRLFVYWKMEPVPRYRFVQTVTGLWKCGNKTCKNATEALDWACDQLTGSASLRK